MKNFKGFQPGEKLALTPTYQADSIGAEPIRAEVEAEIARYEDYVAYSVTFPKSASRGILQVGQSMVILRYLAGSAFQVIIEE